ncbi:MAG: hypothetical protein IKQ41_11295 [Clostridia bacterium]|nr:hypothetical protein [Clostridia bacterium]
MQQEVRINLLGSFSIQCNGQTFDSIITKTKKGAALMEYLILQRGRIVPIHRIIADLNGNSRKINPENALKTLVSRLRVLLNNFSPGLGACIVSTPGAYRWICQSNVTVDVLELIETIELAKNEIPAEEKEAAYKKILSLYQGDLFRISDFYVSTLHESVLHREYLSAVYAYIEMLKEREAYNEISQVCRKAIQIDHADEQLRLELMRAMVQLNHLPDATDEYRQILLLGKTQLGADMSEEMKSSYVQKVKMGRRLNFNLDSIRNELQENDLSDQGPFLCDYASFKTIYNLQIRYLERFSSTIFLGIIMVGEEDEVLDAVSRESAMAGLIEILRVSLRRGDIITRFSPCIIAMLLPTVNYETGFTVMERIEYLFNQLFPSKNIPISYRICPLGEHLSTYAGQLEIKQKGEAE